MKLTVAKMGGLGVIDTGTKLDGAHCDKNGRNWCYRQNWVDLSMTKIGGTPCGKKGGTDVIDTMTKMGGAHCGKNG